MEAPVGSIKLELESSPDLIVNVNASALSPNMPSSEHRKRERRPNSPTAMSALLDTLAEPASPESSTDQASSVDATFEPTIEMMIDDFDDEQTLNEEEAMAALDAEDAEDEISNLQKESEMPIEELIAKYRMQQAEHIGTAHNSHHVRKKSKSGSKKMKKHAKVKSGAEHKQANDQENGITKAAEAAADVIVIDSGDEEEQEVNNEHAGGAVADDADDDEDELDKEDLEGVEDRVEHSNDLFCVPLVDKQKHQKRSHLLDLYPEKYALTENVPKAVTALDSSLFDGDGDVDGDDDDDDDEPDTDYVRKTIMVGSAYQAVIPTGLSKYGDVLPYENEDKLIWEPSQVSEKQVEDYLIKTREIKNYLSDDKEEQSGGEEEEEEPSPNDDELETQNLLAVAEKQLKNSTSENGENEQDELEQTNKDAAGGGNVVAVDVAGESELPKVIKDNEQALHLLVQCGYDFKEALRRKRLNAVPLAGSMSIWSEEECRKFEEGIQKFGKDFLRIRQQQVRTRSMRELVQFYYLWKKSERRDHEFADSDTVDHMDMYLNEGDYNANNMSGSNLGGAHNSQSPSTSDNGYNRKGGLTLASKNYSIMKGGSPANVPSSSTSLSTTTAGKSNQSALTQKSSHGRRHCGHGGGGGGGVSGHNDYVEHIAAEKCSEVQSSARK